ncbi:MAG: hypothetical protein HOM21_09350 [Halobacteriovoraceae bacterium]|nr:hypothetical protein [Halobacteriovoraceae bacterium]
MADKPHDKPNESRHITRMNYVAKSAQKQGCLVYKAHNKTHATLLAEIKKFLKENNIDKNDKFHFSFSDHGADGKIPLTEKERYITPNEFFKDIVELKEMKGAHITYATHICWGAQISQSSIVKSNPNICGSTSVDRNNLSYALTNPKKKTGELESVYTERKDKVREREYLGAGWKWISQNPTKASLHNYHYKGLEKDHVNALRGGMLSSVSYAREILEKKGKYHLPETSEIYNPYLEGPDYQVSPKKGVKSCRRPDGAPQSSSSFEQHLDNLKNLISSQSFIDLAFFSKKPLSSFLTTYKIAQGKFSKEKYLAEIKAARELYKKGRQELGHLAALSPWEDQKAFDNFTEQLESDRQILNLDAFIKKYSPKFFKSGDAKGLFKEADSEQIGSALYENLTHLWDTRYKKKINQHLKKVAYRSRVESDMKILRTFLQNIKPSDPQYQTLIGLMKCEQKALY